MSESKPKPPKPKLRRGIGFRTGLLGLLLAVVAALAIWLSDCVPGFGIGDEGEGEGQPATEKSEKSEKAEPSETKAIAPPPLGEAAPPTIEIGVLGCTLNDEAEQPCAELCKRIEKGELAGAESVTLKSEQGSHADVTAVIDCLKAAGITKMAIEKG